MTNTTLYRQEFNVICDIARANEEKKKIYRKMDKLQCDIDGINTKMYHELEESKADPALGSLLELWEKKDRERYTSDQVVDILKKVGDLGVSKESKK